VYDEDALIGRVVGGYRIESLIGRGGMGVVYRAVAASDGKVVALKLMNPQLADDPVYRSRFLREAELRIDHPNIIPIDSAGSDGAELYIAMRYVDGCDLAALFDAEGKILPGRLIRIAEQAARALDAAHQEGVVHRDVKPQNILVESRGSGDHVFLTDFGLVKRLSARSSTTAASGLLGSIHYMSPEQIRGESLDGRADVYALACVLYEALTGSPPFRRDSDIATLWAQVNEEPPSAVDQAPALPDAVDTVLWTGMAKVREDRYLTATELVHALKGAFAATKPAPAAPRRAAPRRAASRPAGAAVPTQAGATTAPIPVPRVSRGAPWVAVVLIMGLAAVGSLALLRARAPALPGSASSELVSPGASASAVPPTARSRTQARRGDSDAPARSRPKAKQVGTAAPGGGSLVPRVPATDPRGEGSLVPRVPATDPRGVSANKDIVFAAPARGQSTNNGEIFVMDPDGTNRRRLTHNGAGVDDLDPEWSPDGERIVFVSDRAGSYDLYVMNADGSDPRRLTKTPDRCEANPTWAPGGRSIVFDTYCLLTSEQSDLYSVSVEGGHVTNLSRHSGNDFGARWSHDGTQIAFTSDRGGFGEEIYVMTPDGSRVERVTFESGNDRDVAWAPGGAVIAFSSDRDGNSYDVYLMDLSSGRVSRLTTGAAAETSPTWSPDGRRLAFLTNATGVYQIWTMSRVGRNQTRILTMTEHLNQWTLAWHS
jgi:serine/threonine-protein kinase